MVDYVLEGPRWGSGAAGTSGGTVTWALSGSVPAIFTPVITAAFADWAGRANIRFQQVSGTADADIVFQQTPIDGPNNTLGVANYSFSGNSFLSASVNFDSSEGWHASNGRVVSSSNFDLFIVAVHEIGHTLGLGHYNAGPAVMNSVLTSAITDLTASDIHGIQALYGRAPSPPAPWAAIVDESFYFAKYPDAASSGLSAADDYDASGWRAGRDPNADFSTTAYLGANPDIAKAGINPVAHFDQFGWKEGRDPSADFDIQLYLQKNPDIAKAGIDPYAHYLQYGHAEGRQTYAAIGKSQDFTHGSFDAEYYLLSNPDVAKAALAASGDTFAFAYQHFHNYGWKEGRNPDAYFDTKYYLSHYTDVAAAGIDPLQHYDLYGWKEGRNASATFNTTAFEHANPDIAAAGIDPLQHYLQYGHLEGRALA